MSRFEQFTTEERAVLREGILALQRYGGSELDELGDALRGELDVADVKWQRAMADVSPLVPAPPVAVPQEPDLDTEDTVAPAGERVPGESEADFSLRMAQEQARRRLAKVSGTAKPAMAKALRVWGGDAA